MGMSILLRSTRVQPFKPLFVPGSTTPTATAGNGQAITRIFEFLYDVHEVAACFTHVPSVCVGWVA